MFKPLDIGYQIDFSKGSTKMSSFSKQYSYQLHCAFGNIEHANCLSFINLIGKIMLSHLTTLCLFINQWNYSFSSCLFFCILYINWPFGFPPIFLLLPSLFLANLCKLYISNILTYYCLSSIFQVHFFIFLMSGYMETENHTEEASLFGVIRSHSWSV